MRNAGHKSMFQACKKNELPWDPELQVSSCLWVASEEGEVLREHETESQCSGWSLLRCQHQVPGGGGGGGGRGLLRGAAPGEDWEGGVQRVEGDWTPGTCAR